MLRAALLKTESARLEEASAWQLGCPEEVEELSSLQSYCLLSSLKVPILA